MSGSGAVEIVDDETTPGNAANRNDSIDLMLKVAQEENSSKRQKDERPWESKKNRIVLETKDGHKVKVSKRILLAESLFFRNLLSGSFPFENDEKISIPFDRRVLKDCIHYIEDWQNGYNPELDMQRTVDIFELACYLAMDGLIEKLSSYIVETVDNFCLVAAYRMATMNHLPLAKQLWTLIIKRFRLVCLNFCHLGLDDNEFSTALRDDRLNILLEEETMFINSWLKKHTDHNTRVTQINRNLLIRNPPNGMWGARYGYVRLRAPAAAIVAVGGCHTDGTMFGTIDSLFDRANVWERANNRYETRPLAFHGTAVFNDKMLVYGGFNSRDYLNCCDAIDLKHGEWSPQANMNEHRSYVGSTEFTDSDGGQFAVAVGGFNGIIRLKSAEIFSNETGAWSVLPAMQHVRSEAACTIIDGKLFAGGGFDGEIIHGHCEMFDFGAQKWISPGALRMSKPRCGSSALTYDRNVVLVLGGFAGSRRLKCVDFFDLREGLWHSMRSMTRTRSNFGCAMVDEYVYVAGGYMGKEPTAEVERLDLRGDRWKAMSPLPRAMSGLKLAAIKNCELVTQLVTSYHPEANYRRVEFPPFTTEI